jgi:hypothetical protein
MFLAGVYSKNGQWMDKDGNPVENISPFDEQTPAAPTMVNNK